MNDLIKVRLISFGYGFLSLFLIALTGVFTSPDFALLVKSNFGDSVITGFILLLVPEVVKHLRNLSVTGKLGSNKQVIII